VLEFGTTGDVIRWGEHKYADPELNSGNTVIVSTANNRFFALGRGIMLELPALDENTGQFGEKGQKVKAAKIRDVLPHGLPPIEIGKPWPIIDESEPVDAVVLDYKVASPGFENAEQVDMPNPMDSARTHLERVAEAMQARQ
jgi:hypothetical protein